MKNIIRHCFVGKTGGMRGAAGQFVLPWLAVCLLGVPGLRAQQSRDPHIGYIFPAGGRSGSATEITVGGQYLEGTKDILVSGSGIRAKEFKYDRPLPQKRLAELREYLQEARKKMQEAKADPDAQRRFEGRRSVATALKEAGATDEEIEKFFDERRRKSDPKRQQNQQIAELVSVTLEIDPGAQPGPRTMRLVTSQGVSNPLTFCVGRLPEQRDKAPGDDSEPAPQVTLPAVLNGQILPGGEDRFTFQAKKGARLVAAMQARDLIPFLADAVPGWFQPVVTVYDPKGHEVAYGDHFRFGPDPVFYFEAPEEGLYRLEIRDALYRGREDFVYRLTLGEIPFVTGIYPMGGSPGVPATVAVSGWNLRRTWSVVKPGNSEGVFPVKELANGFVSGDVSFAVGGIPERVENEPNNDPQHAQGIQLPVVINGRIDSPGDVDWFSFSCKAGDKVVAEVTARRLNSLLDSWLKVVGPDGRQVAFNDDCEDKGAGLLTHNADSYLAFTATAAGVYFVEIGDSQKKGGPEYGYRLRISAPKPDFALRVAPSGVNGRPGEIRQITVYALRKDGFTGEINFNLTGSAAGFVLNGGCIPSGEEKVRATLTFPEEPAGNVVVSLGLEGNANVEGRKIVRQAVPADDMLQAFFYHHLVPANEWIALVSGTFHGRAPIQVQGPEPMKLSAGGTARIVLSLKKRPPFNVAGTELQLNDPPQGITVENAAPDSEGVAVTFKADPAKVKAGLRGNLILEAFGIKEVPAKDGKTPEKKRWPMGLMPAIPFEVTAK